MRRLKQERRRGGGLRRVSACDVRGDKQGSGVERKRQERKQSNHPIMGRREMGD